MLNEQNNIVYLKGEFIARGSHKNVFNVVGHPDKVMKFGPKVVEEANKFNEIPDVTPKVYYIDNEKKFVVVEKLDTVKFNEKLKKTIKKNFDRKDFIEEKIFQRILVKIKTDDEINFLQELRNVILITKIKDNNIKNFGYTSDGVLKCLDLID